MSLDSFKRGVLAAGLVLSGAGGCDDVPGKGVSPNENASSDEPEYVDPEVTARRRFGCDNETGWLITDGEECRAICRCLKEKEEAIIADAKSPKKIRDYIDNAIREACCCTAPGFNGPFFTWENEHGGYCEVFH